MKDCRPQMKHGLPLNEECLPIVSIADSHIRENPSHPSDPCAILFDILLCFTNNLNSLAQKEILIVHSICGRIGFQEIKYVLWRRYREGT